MHFIHPPGLFGRADVFPYFLKEGDCLEGQQMLRVLIVDDEVSARMLVMNLLRQLPECTVVGEAANGLQALEMVDMLRPNVVLADVVMPEMDGIALAAQIRDRYPEVQVIMLTMYSDFSYAVEAMRSGAIDYILKDSYDAQPLMRAMEKAKTLLRRQSEQEMILRKKQLEDQAFHKAWKGRSGRFFILTDQKYRYDSVRETDALAAMMDITRCIAAGDGFWFFEGGSVPSVHPGILLGRQLADAQDADFLQFRQSCLELFYEPDAAVLSGAVYDGMLHKEALDQLHNEFSEFILKRNSSFPDRYIAACRNARLAPEEVRTGLISFIRDMEWDSPQTADTVRQIREAGTAHQLVLLLQAMLLRMDLDDGRERNREILFLKQYIRLHPGVDLSLHVLADRVNLSPAYLSTLFKRQTGKGLKRYIMDTRLAVAAEYLRSTSLKIYEVADRCGFPNVRYFTNLFSKSFGMTPQQYRRRGSGE